MKAVVIIIFVICAMTGLLQAIFSLIRSRAKTEMVEKANDRIKVGFWTFTICTAALAFLVTNLFGPVELLITVPLLLALGFAVSRVRLADIGR